MKGRVRLRERGGEELMGGVVVGRRRREGEGEGGGEEGEEKLGGKGERLRVEGLLVELLRVV